MQSLPRLLSQLCVFLVSCQCKTTYASSCWDSVVEYSLLDGVSVASRIIVTLCLFVTSIAFCACKKEPEESTAKPLGLASVSLDEGDMMTPPAGGSQIKSEPVPAPAAAAPAAPPPPAEPAKNEQNKGGEPKAVTAFDMKEAFPGMKDGHAADIATADMFGGGDMNTQQIEADYEQKKKDKSSKSKSKSKSKKSKKSKRSKKKKKKMGDGGELSFSGSSSPAPADPAALSAPGASSVTI